MYMNFVGAFELEYGRMVDFSIIISNNICSSNSKMLKTINGVRGGYHCRQQCMVV